MKLLALLWHYLIPRFTTSYYLHATRNGERVVVVLYGPEDVEEEYRQYILVVRYLLVFGRPLLTQHRYFSD